MSNDNKTVGRRVFSVMFSTGGHSALWHARAAPNAVTAFKQALALWPKMKKGETLIALVAIEFNEKGRVKEGGEFCGFDSRTSDNMITYYTRAGMKLQCAKPWPQIELTLIWRDGTRLVANPSHPDFRMELPALFGWWGSMRSWDPVAYIIRPLQRP